MILDTKRRVLSQRESMAEAARQYTHGDYTVGWVCALPKTELVAAAAMLDDEHPVLPAADSKDTNAYLLGRIGSHNVVIACLPAEMTGKVSAATVAKDMVRSFKAVRFGLLVGIGGGAPCYGAMDNSEDSEEDNDLEDSHDIRLGDVVVSQHSKSREAVVQYDFESFFANPNMATRFRCPGPVKDKLFKSDVVHPDGERSCKLCCGLDDVNLIRRKDRSSAPRIHYGTIGSADQVMKDATLRDKWAQEENIPCFEMEAAGLMDSFPCLLIRGICDYADSHKNKAWQSYAAVTAAAYAKELLNVISAAGVTDLLTVNDAIGKLRAELAANNATSQKS
ncbi:purine and uridine phosphorylase [Cadophora sp. DSE1049]|nr:purine and uridine phosphorylase [Cadophora sp. DSE1049]